eukprot:Blabericola_migrator_1__5214@NODE_2686_length_2460_cov_49_693272_g1679_i0_p1_GENE_NODE_2686_length_2460_cov_49_693272_g1679_i0NODE_2686_length_2460_cov_49_693272_g1679_i0_p1_ORF_typecomplete_len111_score12_40_NODE_2686_length_2460_cov_49_693272_g1679_i07841116
MVDWGILPALGLSHPSITLPLTLHCGSWFVVSTYSACWPQSVALAIRSQPAQNAADAGIYGRRLDAPKSDDVDCQTLRRDEELCVQLERQLVTHVTALGRLHYKAALRSQ